MWNTNNIVTKQSLQLGLTQFGKTQDIGPI